MPNIKGPDGKVIAFPEGTSDADIAAAFSGVQPPSPQSQHPVLDAITDFGKGIVKGGIHTMSMADEFAASHLPRFMTTPIGQTPNVENSNRAVQTAKDMATPHNTAQSIGRGVEQAGEYLIPGGAEEQVAKSAGNLLRAVPKVAKAAPVIGRLIASGLGAGTVNAAQGGDFSTGAATGAAGAGVGMGLKAIAPIIAESALKVRGIDRAFGRTPGEGILNETTGLRPATVAKQAGAKVAQYTGDLEDAARQSPYAVDLQPARDVADSWLDTAAQRNNASTVKDVSRIGEQLSKRQGTAIPRQVPASEALALKRGIGDLQTSWDPATVSDFSNRAVASTYSAMHPELERAIPGYAELNGKISTMMPVASRATAADLNAGFVQRGLDRFRAHTGALVAPMLAASAGGATHGPVGALAGGGLALAAQEAIASPELQLGVARLANSPATRKFVIPALAGLGLQINRPDASQ